MVRVLVCGVHMVSLLAEQGRMLLYVHAMLYIGVAMTLIFAHVYFSPMPKLRRAVASRDWQAGACRPSLGMEGESRSFPTAPELEGRFLGLRVGLACDVGPGRLNLLARSGQDAARASRPGGNQRQTELRLFWSRRVGAGQLVTDLGLYGQQDSNGYSPLLANGATRHVRRATLYVEYAYPISPNLSVLASLEGLGQHSNVELFDVSGRALYVGLRWGSGR